MDKIECGYRKNEWIAMYVDMDGEKIIETFDTYEQAEKFLQNCVCKIGVMTTRFFNHYIAENLT